MSSDDDLRDISDERLQTRIDSALKTAEIYKTAHDGSYQYSLFMSGYDDLIREQKRRQEAKK